MQAVVYEQEVGLRLSNSHPRYEPGSGWARIRMLRAGICGTDLELMRGYRDFSGVPGHEFVGVVDACPDERDLEGRRVVGEINSSCGECAACLRGHRSHCERRRVLGILNLDGAFAEYLLLPIENLHLVPDSVSDEEAVFVEPLAAACEILELEHLRPTDRIYVMGAGKLGLLVGQVLNLIGAEVTLIGKHADQLDMAASWGLLTLLNNGAQTPDLSPADVVVECTGNAEGVLQSSQLVRPRGTLVLKSTYHGKAIWPHNDMVVSEIRVVGSRCGPFPPALRLLERGAVHVRPLINAVYPLKDAMSAFEHAARPGILKVVLAGSE